MELNLFEFDQLEIILENLPPFHRIAFSAAISERMFPIYEVFSQEESWGNPKILRDSLDEVWQILCGKEVEEKRILQLIEQCNEQVLHSEEITESRFDLESHLAVGGICVTLESFLEPTTKNALRVASFISDMIFAFLDSKQEDIDPNWTKISFEDQEQYIINHQFARQELQKQEEDLKILQESKNLNQEIIELLRISSTNRSPISLSK